MSRPRGVTVQIGAAVGLVTAGLALGAGPAAAEVTAPVLHSFAQSGGCQPLGELLDGGDGFLYGTTSLGGSGVTNPAGTVYRITPGGDFTSLHAFDFQVTGDQPRAGLVRRASDGVLFGTTRGSGAFNGSAFRIEADGSDFQSLHTFTGYFVGADAAHPEAPLVDAGDGNLYGTTAHGGASNVGTIYRIEPDGDYAIVHSFSGLAGAADGFSPLGGLVRGEDGALYGTTSGLGSAGHGTVFRYAPGGGGVETLHSFTGADGSQPTGELVKGFDGALYGVTGSGGASSQGTVFRIREDGGGFQSLHSFSSAGGGGSTPVGLGAGGDGNLYGATSLGGASFLGTVFRIRWNGAYRQLYSFTSTANGGYGPQGAPIAASDGGLYGTTLLGGANGCGTIYRLDGIPVPEPAGAAVAAALALALAAARRRAKG